MPERETRVSLLCLLGEYWTIYGGWKELCRSPYLYMAILLTFCFTGLWRKPDWWADVLTILPVVMGISLAAFTLFLSAGSEKFRRLIAGTADTDKGSDTEPNPSPFLRTSAVFLHFLIVQFIAIVLALASKAAFAIKAPRFFVEYNEIVSEVFWFVGYFAFVYSLCTVLAASFGVFEVVRWFDDFVSSEREPPQG